MLQKRAVKISHKEEIYIPLSSVRILKYERLVYSRNVARGVRHAYGMSIRKPLERFHFVD
jgi:hypothetical protein